MKLKEAQLLGILAIIAGGIIILSMWGSKPDADQGDVSDSRPATSSAVDQREDDATEEWKWLTEREEEPSSADESGSEESGAASLSVEGDTQQRDASVPELAIDDPFRPQMALEEGIEQQLEEGDPADIGLHEAEEMRRREDRSSPTEDGQPKIYEVQRGDTLSAISRNFYGTPAKWQRILEANRGLMQVPRDLRPEMKLVIPSSSGEVGRTDRRSGSGDKPLLASPEDTEDRSPRHHTVREDDTLWNLAQRFYNDGQQYRKILEANDNISSPAELKVGMRLVIPQ